MFWSSILCSLLNVGIPENARILIERYCEYRNDSKRERQTVFRRYSIGKIVYVIEICWQCFHRVTLGDFSNSLKRFLICLLSQSIVVDPSFPCEAREKYFERASKLIICEKSISILHPLILELDILQGLAPFHVLGCRRRFSGHYDKCSKPDELVKRARYLRSACPEIWRHLEHFLAKTRWLSMESNPWPRASKYTFPRPRRLSLFVKKKYKN